jgi:hypothetical protein
VESFLSGLGSKLADKWLATLVLPGLLFVGVTLVGAALGYAHAFDADRLLQRAADGSTQLHRYGAPAILLAVAAAGLLASAVALAANWLGSCVQRISLAAWPGWVSSRLVAWRRQRWTTADDACAQYEMEIREFGAPPPARDNLAAARNRIALAYPGRPTWVGDRVHATEVRVFHSYGIDLGAAWPRIWLLLNESDRAEVTAARDSMNRAAALIGWGILYTALAIVWWPVGLAGLVVIFTGWYQARAATANFADLVEAVIDLNAQHLAVALGVITDRAAFTRAVGGDVNSRMRKGT